MWTQHALLRRGAFHTAKNARDNNSREGTKISFYQPSGVERGSRRGRVFSFQNIIERTRPPSERRVPHQNGYIPHHGECVSDHGRAHSRAERVPQHEGCIPYLKETFPSPKKRSHPKTKPKKTLFQISTNHIISCIMNKRYPGRPSRLPIIFRKFDPPLYFITFCTFKRQPFLANDAFHNYFKAHMKRKVKEGIVCGEYVIMPDHIHFFLRIDPQRYQLGKTVGFIKQSLSNPLRNAGIPRPYWQPGFFDHILRSADSYSEKWDYVRNNPVRAGLVNHSHLWKFYGVIVPIRY